MRGEKRGKRERRVWDRPPRQFNLRISQELFQKIDEDHWKQRKPMNQIINDILNEHYR